MKLSSIHKEMAFLGLLCEELPRQRVSGSICHFACGLEKGMVGHCTTNTHVSLDLGSKEFGQDPRFTIDYYVFWGK